MIKASRKVLYQAFTSPEALAIWLAPGEMTGKVKKFDLRVGGGYQMSLFYPQTDKNSKGKTNKKEDRFFARFVELTPPKKIVQIINFDSSDPKFKGEMIMEITFQKKDNGTKVTFVFKNIPPGISPEDNKAGTRSTLKKLAHYIEAK